MPALATVATFGFADFHPPTVLELYHRLGAVGGQFYRNEADPPTAEQVVATCREAGVPIDSMHGVFGDGYDPSSPDEATRRRGVDTYRDETALAHRIGAPMMVVHPAPLSARRVPVDAGEADQRREALRRSLEELAEMGRELEMVYLIENLPEEGRFGRDPRELAGMLREVGSPHLRMCFDTGHALITTGDTPAALIDCADVIGYIHIHDNDGLSDRHLMPGDGIADWPGIGRALAETGLDVPLMLEVFYSQQQIQRYADSDFPARLADWLGVRPPSPSR